MGVLRIPIAVICLSALPAAALAQAVGVSPDGKKGRIHTVIKGDTLWDITATYVGTPWIWPAIWKENDIRNPHRIYPGDMLWFLLAGRPRTAEVVLRFRGWPSPILPWLTPHTGLPAAPRSAAGRSIAVCGVRP